VHAIDLEAGGVEVTGARVFAQSVALPENTLRAAIELGATPLPPHELDSGDWRLTVVDDHGPEMRHSELRVLALPGEDLGLRVVFLRRTADVVQGMAYREACSSRCGTPHDAVTGPLDQPETTSSVGELWIDPFEVSCEDYSRFYLDLQRHPQWFDGSVPVHRPRVLSEDGTCPRALARRPIVDVTWNEAVLYANWAGKRLPTEREWERVARGTDVENRRYPWGKTFEAKRVNDSASASAQVQARKANDNGTLEIRVASPRFEDLLGGDVDAPEFNDGGTPEGSEDRVFRMADNVFEFVEDLFVEGMSTSTPSLIDAGTVARVVKGGSWKYIDESLATTWARSSGVTNVGTRMHGFRCVKTAKPGFETK
jgi:formylglycine-generating enzyme required for sulfatase activity